MAIGRPAAQVALYHPGNSIWMGGDAANEADRSTTKLGWELFEHQVDWDYFDEQSLSNVAKLENGGFTNLSGQTYKAVVLPSMTVITRTGLERLREFAKEGGKVIFVGKTPTMILDKTFMDANEKPDLSFATLVESSGDITPAVLAALPSPDVKLDAEFKRLTYTHRKWTDGDMYFFFNESSATEKRVAKIAGHDTVQDWDMANGEIHPIAAAKPVADGVEIPLVLGPYETRVIVVGPLPKYVGAAEPSFSVGSTVAQLDGDWSVAINGKDQTTVLKPWEELGAAGFAGPATYKKQFTAAALAKGKHVYLELGDVHDYAKVMLNGKDLGARAWGPYRWDVTGALKKGANEIVIDVNAPPAARGGPGGAPPPAAVVAATPAAGLATAPGARRRQGGSAGASAAPAGGGRGGPAVPAVSGLLGPVKLVAY
jgi:hypothetical protein